MRNQSRKGALALAMLAVLTLSACGDKDTAEAGVESGEGKTTSTIPTDFYLEPFNEGCERFSDLDSSDLLGEKVAPIHSLGDENQAECVYSLANDARETPSKLVWVGVAMATDDDLWSSYEAFDESDYWMHETRSMPQDSPWQWGFSSYYDWNDGNGSDSHAELMQLVTTDTSGTFRFFCEYRGEPTPETEDSTYLMDEVASVEEDLVAFCTDALDRAIVKTD